MLDGKEVIFPKYNFLTGKREYYKNKVKMSDKSIFLIEGLHALNEELTKDVDEKYKYISLIPLTTQVTGVTLKGFKYLLQDATLTIGESIGISNEQIEKRAEIKLKDGILICIESKD